MTEFSPENQQNLENLLAERARSPRGWSKPDMYNLARDDDRQTVETKLANGEISTVFDPLETLVSDVFEHEHPEKRMDVEARAEYIKDIQAQGAAYGKWFHFPWSNQLVRYPDRDIYRALHSSRNRELVTDEEQRTLYAASIAILGLSVGSNVVERLVASGIGGTLTIGDPDTLELPNLNRINASFTELGDKKLHIAARKISEADPYITQVHLAEGVTPENLDLIKEQSPQLIVDEIDNLAMKAVLRLFAYKEGIPLVMATDVDDRAPLDVERYDLGTATPFGGRLTEEQVTKLANNELSPEEMFAVRVAMVGPENVTPRLMESVQKMSRGELGGLPQLGSTAAVGGSHVAVAARQIILGRELPTGRYMSTDEIVSQR